MRTPAVRVVHQRSVTLQISAAAFIVLLVKAAAAAETSLHVIKSGIQQIIAGLSHDDVPVGASSQLVVAVVAVQFIKSILSVEPVVDSSSLPMRCGNMACYYRL